MEVLPQRRDALPDPHRGLDPDHLPGPDPGLDHDRETTEMGARGLVHSRDQEPAPGLPQKEMAMIVEMIKTNLYIYV